MLGSYKRTWMPQEKVVCSAVQVCKSFKKENALAAPGRNRTSKCITICRRIQLTVRWVTIAQIRKKFLRMQHLFTANLRQIANGKLLINCAWGATRPFRSIRPLSGEAISDGCDAAAEETVQHHDFLVWSHIGSFLASPFCCLLSKG